MDINFKSKLPQTEAFVFDIDGVLTDGSVHCNAISEQTRVMNIKDGYALQLVAKKQIPVLILSGGMSEGARLRLQKLGIKDIKMGVEHKLPVLKTWLFENHIKPENCLYMGDDIPDYECMKFIGMPCCPADACNDIKEICPYVSPISGGKGCVRDVIEQVLKARGLWLDKDAHSW